jgi:putative salt-induced outer membrane protein YdiY
LLSEESKKMPHKSRAVLAVAVLFLLAGPARAQQVATPTEAKAVDDKAFKADAPGTYANADLSYVLTSGNSSSSTLGFKGDVTHRWGKSSLGFAAGGLTASSSPDTRYAVGTPGDFEVVVPPSEQTAENYYARGRYDYKLSERVFYTLGAGWERNQFSGIQNRWVGDTGIGYIFLNNDRTSFRSALGITYTNEDYTVDDGGDGSFVGARLGWDFRHRVFAGTTFTHTLIADENLEDTADLRVDAQFGLQVAMTKKLGLKVNWRLLWDNQPALSEYSLHTPGGTSTGLTVLAPYKELDQGVSVSFVFSFAPPKKG